MDKGYLTTATRPGRFLSLTALTLAIVFSAGCGSIGPRTMDKDQLSYGDSISNNWKNQMLSNIVKLRYVDMPVFVDVGSIVAGYSMETQVSGRLGFSDSFTGTDSQGLGASGKFTDRPTITYMPKTGDDYLRSLLTPVEPKNLLALIQAGYNAEMLFTWSVEAINGVQNYSGSSKSRMEADPGFYELAGLMQELQALGTVAWEFDTDPDTGHDVLLVMRKDGRSQEIKNKRARVAELLGLDSSINKFRVVYAPTRLSSDTLAIQTRSIVQTLTAMARFIDVPAELSDQAAPGFKVSSNHQRPFRVLSAEERPDDYFAAVKYRDYWYWIENTDLVSKRVFTLMLFLTTLTDNAGEGMGPVLTIPTG